MKYIVLTMAETRMAEPDHDVFGPGYRIIEFPMIRTEPLEIPPDIFSTALKADWLVFTSQNAVWYFLDHLEKEVPASKITKPSLAAIGHSTSDLLVSNGLKVRFIPTRSNRVILSQELPVLSGQKVSVFTSEQTNRSEYEAILQKGASLHFNFLYRTLPIEHDKQEWDKVIELRPSAFCFLSSSAVTSFFNQLKSCEIRLQPDNFTWGAIGPVTARELMKWIAEPIIQPESSTLNSLLQAIWKTTVTVQGD